MYTIIIVCCEHSICTTMYCVLVCDVKYGQ